MISRIKGINGGKRISRGNKIMSVDISKKTLNETSKSLIEIDCDEFAFLRKTIYDFQYLNFEFSRDIKVYRLLDKDNEFIVQGLKKTIMFTPIHNPLTKQS